MYNHKQLHNNSMYNSEQNRAKLGIYTADYKIHCRISLNDSQISLLYQMTKNRLG